MFARFYALRYVCVLAVISLFAGSLLMFLSGAFHTIDAYLIFFLGRSVADLPGHLTQGAAASVVLIQAVDTFLFALVLLIFAYGVYTLFIDSQIDNGEPGKLPAWLRIGSISQLKTVLVQVIIVILAVNLLEHVVIVGSESLKWETLIIPVSMVGLALALKLMHTGKEV